MAEGRRPVSALAALSSGEVLNSTSYAQHKLDTADPETQWGLGVARVVEVDYEEFLVTLQILVGASGDTERIPVPLTFPGAGARHFFGSMPQRGDMCVVGWMPQESSKPRNRTPVILNWIVPGVWPGREWVTTSNFTHDEMGFGAQYQRDIVGGVLPRVRHKLRHIQPGNIVASSSQGSDLVLDEGVILANRRGNEFRLRDQDQAAVTRALQRFDALAGSRSYAGMVQRDATLLSTQMFSDGRVWDGKRVVLNGRPLREYELEADPNLPPGSLTPSRVFGGGFRFSPNIDPFLFLARGGFIDSQKMSMVDSPDAVYGGKPMFKVATQGNGAIDPKVPVLTEHRIELSHTTNGQLPVTEQTDMFDADRLPSGEEDGGLFIEWVMGSVVGNDPFSPEGKEAYGRPLIARVFDGDVANPRLDTIPLAFDPTDLQVPIERHAATLFRLKPLNGAKSTFWSVNKQGQVKASISGPARENSVELATAGSIKVKSRELDLELEKGLSLKGPLNLTSADGQLDLSSGVDIQSRKGLRLKATRKVYLKGSVVDVEGGTTRIRGYDIIEMATAGKIRQQAETVEEITTGRKAEEFSGPKGFLPTNAPLHSQTYTPSLPGITAKEVRFTLGDRKETFNLGNHSTTVLVGNQTYESVLGKVTLKGTTSTVDIGPEGVSTKATVGNISLQAVAGSASMKALTSVYIAADAGTATLKGAAGVVLSGPLYGPDQGPILCAGSLEPFTGLPYTTWGIGAKGHVVSS